MCILTQLKKKMAHKSEQSPGDKIVKDSETWHAAVHGVSVHGDTTEPLNNKAGRHEWAWLYKCNLQGLKS